MIWYLKAKRWLLTLAAVMKVLPKHGQQTKYMKRGVMDFHQEVIYSSQTMVQLSLLAATLVDILLLLPEWLNVE